MNAVPNSSGTRQPRLQAPPGSCDAHIHIYDTRFPAENKSALHTDNAAASDYRLLQARLGTSRAVVVTPRYYGQDNRATLSAIQLLGTDRARGVAVVDPGIADSELVALKQAGVCGLRFTMHHREVGDPLFAQIAQFAPRAASHGMHLQLHWTAPQIAAHAQLLLAMPGTMVIDHMGRLPPDLPHPHAARDTLLRLLDRGHTWIKLSGSYLLSTQAPAYEDLHALGRMYVHAAPQRMLWGSDWPHVSERGAKPDDADLLDLLGQWAPGTATQRMVLVDNPAQLYGFAAGTSAASQ